MARRGRCAPARSTAKSPTAFAANGAPRSTPISDPSSKPHGEDRSEPSTPSASPSKAAPSLAQLENANADLSNYLLGEAQADYFRAAANIVAVIQPKDVIEDFLTRDVIDLDWENRRLRRAKAGLLRAADGKGVGRILST